jgi:CPA2 family monovalent cation:H+ antiporter-2
LRQNAVIGYLVAGIVLGPRTFGFVKDPKSVEVLAELGVALLLFTIGLEFSWRRLRGFGKTAALLGVLQIGVTIFVGGGLATFAGLTAQASFVVSAALAMSSTAVVLRLLIERAELDSPHGRNALSILLMQDLAVVPLLIMVSVFADGASGAGAIEQLAFSMVKAVALVGAFFVVIRFVLPFLITQASAARNRDLPVVLAIAVSLGCSWSAHAVGLSPVLGAFAAGILLADLEFAEQIRADVMPLRAAFVTLFFASIGMLAAVPSALNMAYAVGLALTIFAIKGGIIAVVALLLRQPLTIAIHTGIVLAQIGEFSFVLMQIAVGKGVLDAGLFDLFLTAAVLMLLLTPYTIQYAGKLSDSIASLLVPSRRQRLAIERHERRSDIKVKRGRVIVVGFGPAGKAVCRALKEQEIPYFILETNIATVSACRVEEPIEIGDATQAEILEHAGVHHAAAVVVSIPDPGISRTVISQCRMIAPEVPVLVRARYSLFADTLREAGADTVVDEEHVVGETLAEETLATVAAAANA